MTMSTAAVFPAPEQSGTAAIVSANVRYLMATRGVTQMQLGAAMNLSQTAISKRLRGVTPWDTTDLDKLAHIFGVAAPHLTAKGPHPDWSAAPGLPRLDSNQQPAGSAPPQVREGKVLQLRRATAR